MSQHALLTGGNGFIATHVIVLLLQGGYTVTATLRAESKAVYLRKKFATSVDQGQLRFAIIEDITVPGAFDDVIKSNKFDIVLHMSSPVVFTVTDIAQDLLTPAIKGTTEILKSINTHGPSVRRVVVTSSFGAVLDPSKGDRPGYAYSEKDWNPVTEEEAQKDTTTGYRASKKLAEKAAWDFIEREKPSFDLVTIAPPMASSRQYLLVYGPALQGVTSLDQLNHSSKTFYSIFSGQSRELTPASVHIWVDVRDVAKAHLAAIETLEAGNNRFLVSEGTYNMGQLSDFIWTNYPERARAKDIPKSTSKDRDPPEGRYYPDNSKSKKILGLQYNSFENMLKDTLEQFIALERELGVE
ncbi:methylglyoxal reductase (NADPH-dependent) gre2 [Ceratobasidium sp. 395]|nr:methylglyoxal reductase (NADPH-dependent) gre2 [Ceratobasidium sp. 395]